MRNLNLYGFVALYGALFLVILFKVFNVPVTIDELPAVFFYSKFNIWEIMMYPDNIPNNHILNTLLTKWMIHLFGNEQWAIRLPNLLAFLLFGVAVFRIVDLLLTKDSPWFLAGAILFVHPFLLDFFGLSRGYGLSVAMVTLSAGFMMAAWMQQKQKYVWFSLIMAILASYANFTALVFWAAVTLLAGLWFLAVNRHDIKKMVRPALLTAIISLAYLALIMTPLLKIHATDELRYWSSRGFYEETIISMIHNWVYNSPLLSRIPYPWYLVTVITAMATAIVTSFRRRNQSAANQPGSLPDIITRPGIIASLLLLIPVLINLAQTIIMGTPNLSGRTSLFLYPLVSIVFVVILSLIPRFTNQAASSTAALILSLLLLANLTHRTSLRSVREWEFDMNTVEVIDYLHDQHPERTVSLKTSWFFNSSFYFYCYSGKTPWLDLQPYDYNIDINTPAEYYYVFAEDYEKLTPRFEIVYKFSPDRWLLRQKKN